MLYLPEKDRIPRGDADPFLLCRVPLVGIGHEDEVAMFDPPLHPAVRDVVDVEGIQIENILWLPLYTYAPGYFPVTSMPP